MNPSSGEGVAANFVWPVAGDSGLIFAFNMIGLQSPSQNVQAKKSRLVQLFSEGGNRVFWSNESPWSCW